MLNEYKSKKAIRELSKNITNLDGSDPITGTEGSRPASREISDAEYDARYDLAFGRITQEEFNKMCDEGRFNNDSE